MTALFPLADFTPAQAERRDRIEAAPEPPEITEYREKLERVAIVIHEHSDTGPGIEGRWCRCGWTGQGHAGHVAAVAIAAIAAPQTGEHTTDEDSNTADELAAAGLRACCGQPSERHCR